MPEYYMFVDSIMRRCGQPLIWYGIGSRQNMNIIITHS